MKTPNKTYQVNWLIMLIGLFLFGIAQGAIASGLTIADQQLGTSTWSDRSKLKKAGVEFKQYGENENTGGSSLEFDSMLIGKVFGHAIFYYNDSDVLYAIELSVKKKQGKKLTSLVEKELAAKQDRDSSAAKEEAPAWQIFKGEDHIRPGNTFFRITTQEFQDKLHAPDPQGFRVSKQAKITLEALGFILCCIAFTIAILLMKKKMPAGAQYYAWACIPATAYVYYYLGEGIFTERLLAWSVIYYTIFWCACWLTCTWAIRTTSATGWLNKAGRLTGLASLVATPLLLIPAVLRNCWKSAHYMGMTIFISGLIAYGCHRYFDDKISALLIIGPVAGFLGGGLVRLYCGAYKSAPCPRRIDYPIVRAVLALFMWPLVFLAFVVVQALSLLLTMIGMWWLLVIAYIVGSIYTVETGWLIAALVCVPTALNLLVMALAPTGYSGVDFGDELSFASGIGSGGLGGGGGGFDPMVFNPANGLPMIGGMGGMDIQGNPFGFDNTNHFDPF